MVPVDDTSVSYTCDDNDVDDTGVEPEPFELGEHLVTASDKLCVVDQLLAYLRPLGHKVLIYSQMTRVLDILQDYLGYRGVSLVTCAAFLMNK